MASSASICRYYANFCSRRSDFWPSLLLLAVGIALPSSSHAAAVTNTVIKQVSAGQLSIAMNLAQWSGNFNYTLVLPASALCVSAA